MKRFFICAAAAIVALASCSKTQVVYNDAPQEIGFKAVTGAITQAPIEGTELPKGSSMVVYASKSDAADGDYDPYFSDAVFSCKDTYWGGSKYWPESGYLKFIAYYPSGIGTASGNATTNITITGVDATDQKDILYTNLSAAHESARKSTVAMEFHHALAQVIVTAKVSDANMTDVNVTKVVLSGAPYSGDLTLTGTNATWDNQAPILSVTMPNTIASTDLTATQKTLGTGLLVVPGEHEATLTVTYTIGGLETTTDPIEIDGTWEKGKKYIYNLSIGLDEIKLDPYVDDWDDAESMPYSPSVL